MTVVQHWPTCIAKTLVVFILSQVGIELTHVQTQRILFEQKFLCVIELKKISSARGVVDHLGFNATILEAKN